MDKDSLLAEDKEPSVLNSQSDPQRDQSQAVKTARFKEKLSRLLKDAARSSWNILMLIVNYLMKCSILLVNFLRKRWQERRERIEKMKLEFVPMTANERSSLLEYKNLFQFVEARDREELPSSMMNLWLGESGSKLVRHPHFPKAIERAKTKKVEFEQKVEHEAEQRLKERFLEFWYYRGLVYGLAKRQERSGDYIFPVAEFFLKRSGQPDKDIEIWRYDLPIANGQDVAVIYGRRKGEETGFPIVFYNNDIKRNIRLTEAFKNLAKKSSYTATRGVSPEQELEEFMRQNKL